MKIDELMAEARDAITVRRVYSEPYERDGVTVITAASVGGGGGGGVGKDEKGGPASASPAGPSAPTSSWGDRWPGARRST